VRALLVSPRTPETFWSFGTILGWISRKAAFPPLGLLTVAAMLPPSWRVSLIDTNVRELRDADIAGADVVMLSAIIVQESSARQIIARCNALGVPVIAGGPLFTTGEDRFPGVASVVRGEAEDLVATIAADFEGGRLEPVYRAATRPDLGRTPVPRWDLIRPGDYATMPLQVSRGCPFDCEFCDITAVYGRVPRVKAPGQVIAELDALASVGWTGHVFVVDDNFIGNRARVKPILREIIEWRRRTGSRVTFTTEASLNLVDDPELMSLMTRAGFKNVFVGIESPQPESLIECAKHQNTRRDLVSSVRAIHRAGMAVMGGFIVGFDSDGPEIFERQRRFIEESGVVTAMIGLLTALPGTRLHTRLTREGRLVRTSTGNNCDGIMNFVPRLDRRVLEEGYRTLVRQVYAPRAYYRRISRMLRDLRPSGPPGGLAWIDMRAFLRSAWVIGVRSRGRLAYWWFALTTLLRRPRRFPQAMQWAIMGHHYRVIAQSV
jgi:radical SAM superfamily enzyme YgiQ (UPF0313 family)